MDFSSFGADKHVNANYSKGTKEEGGARDTVNKLRRRSRKRRSFLDSEHTSRVSFPQPDPGKPLDVMGDDAQMLSLDPEPSGQTENPSPTVSSLTHSEGEPAQLESKPIVSRRRRPGPAPPSAPGVHGEAGEPRFSCQPRKQEMEMEPDSMESKSLTATVLAATPSITVVRRRVDPGGKECSDRRGDAKEEGEGPEDAGDESAGGEKQEPGTLSPPNTSEEEESNDADKKSFFGSSSGAERQPEAPSVPASLADSDRQGQSGLLGAQRSAPPPPPPSPLPAVAAALEEELPHHERSSPATEEPVNQEVGSSDQEQQSGRVVSPTMTSSHETPDSNSSHKVSEEDEGSHSLTSNSCERKGERSAAWVGAQTGGHRFDRDYDRAINAIAAKLGAATNVASPAFYSGTKLKGGSASERVAREEPEKLRAVVGADPVRAARGGDLDPPSPVRFPSHACSPVFVARLSASTLRGKIQQLPRYLSKSQESLNQPGGAPGAGGRPHAAQTVGITVTGVDDVTQSLDPDVDTSAEPADSDDSDATVTGSDVDGEYFMDTASADSPLPVQTEPRAPNLPPHAAPSNHTPGPVTQAPASTVNSIHRDASGAQRDTVQPGPVTVFPSSPVVLTRQSMNGPGLPVRSQCPAGRTSSDRPLVGLCAVPGQKDRSKLPSPDCRVFTICEAAAPEPSGLLKPGCNALLASGCESLGEGLQLPLDACDCPPLYAACFGSSDSFDEELTVFEISCRSQKSGATQSCAGGPLPSFMSNSSTVPAFFPGSASELGPLLSPLADASAPPLARSHQDALSRLAQQWYPEPPAGFQALRLDVDKLLAILENNSTERCVAGRHPREVCPAHFTENRRVLQAEARRLMSGCQTVVGDEQSPGDMLRSLAKSFRTLLDLAGLCLLFSGCDRCERRNGEAVAGLADVARSFRDFCLAAERVSSKRSCQDLSLKLLAKQRTALTASVFCLTQLFRTLTAL